MAELPGDPSYSTVRTQLRVLEGKGHVRHEQDGQRYVYSPAAPRRTVRRSALKHLVETFFEGSVEQVVAALLGGEGGATNGRTARSHRRPDQEGQKGRRVMDVMALTLKTSLVLGLGMLAVLALRRRSAAVRHWMLALAVSCAAAVPVIGALTPRWSMPTVAVPASERRPNVDVSFSRVAAAAPASLSIRTAR
jgi:hypothetical protein